MFTKAPFIPQKRQIKEIMRLVVVQPVGGGKGQEVEIGFWTLMVWCSRTVAMANHRGVVPQSVPIFVVAFQSRRQMGLDDSRAADWPRLSWPCPLAERAGPG